MKRQLKKMFALLMAITVMSALVVPASATEITNTQDTRLSSPFPFSMTVAATYKELTTVNNSAKRFIPDNITESNVTAQFASTDCPFRMSGAGSSVEAVWVSG